MRKICFLCQRMKPMDEFYRHAAMADGYLNKCKECTCTDVRENRRLKSDHYREYERMRAMRPDRVAAREKYQKTQQGKAAMRRANRWQRLVHPERIYARNAVSNALRDGKITRLPCSQCGADRAHAHHDDYAKPLDVVWRCPPCHTNIHRSERAA